MPLTLDFHDSEILDITAQGALLRVRFAAASVSDAEGRHGWIPTVQLALADATEAEDVRHAFGKITEGRLRHDGREVGRLALPVTLDGAIELDLRLANGSSLALQARALTATFDAAARFTEDLSC